MRLTVSIDIIKRNPTLSIDRLFSISYFNLTIKPFILLRTLETFQDRNDKPSKPQRLISQQMLNAHRQL